MFCTARWWLLLPRDTVLLVIVNIGALLTLKSVSKDWLFDVDSLTISMNYVPVVAGNQTNGITETRDNIVTGQAEKKTEPEQEYILIPICTTDPFISHGPKDSEEDSGMKPTKVDNSKNSLFEQFSPFKNAFTLPDVPNVFSIDDTRIFGNAYDDEDVGAEADLNNLETTMNVSLDELEKNVEQVPPYNSTPPTLDDIRNLIHRRTIHEKENVYSAIGNRDHTQAIIALMLYYLENGQPFNLANIIIRRMYYFRDRRDKVLPYGMILTRLFKDLKANMAYHPFDECYILVPRKMSSLKAKQPKKPPSKRTRNIGKSKRAQLTTSSLFDSPPSDNGDLPGTKLSPRSYSRALPNRTNISQDQRETRGMFKNLARALHKFAKMLKKGCH
ncbi:hypothetical protein Tco_0781652 [Tanacetum coccineum]